MSALDTLIYGYRTILAATVAVAQRNKLNFGAGFTVADNPGTSSTDITLTGSSGTPTGTGIPHVVAGVMNAATSLIVDADVSAAAGVAVSKLAAGTNGQILHTLSGTPTWGALVATEDIALTGTQHDLALATPSTVPITIVRFTDAGGCSVTSMAGGTAGRLVIWAHVGGGGTVEFLDQSAAGGTAANRLAGFIAGAMQLQDTGLALLVYDGTSSRWRYVSKSF